MQISFSVVVAAALSLAGHFCHVVAAAAPKPLQDQSLQVGAFAMDITPSKYPVIVNGMFEERTADRAVDPLFARAFVFSDGARRIAIVVVDSCMLPRELLDEAKLQASKRTGIPTDHMLISATHTHSAPSSMGCLGTRPDPTYQQYLLPRLARAIENANDRLQPAQLGFAKLHAPQYTFCRRYIRRPDRMFKDPFGELNVRAHMNPGFLSPDVIGPSGPVDDELSLVAMQSRDGRPIGLLANFSMHYIGSPLLSSDYFGRFAEHLGKRVDGGDGSGSCVVAMSQGTSGDLTAVNYSGPKVTLDYDKYAGELAELAAGALRDVKYSHIVPLAMAETKLKLRRRVPDAKRLAWAKQMAAKIGDQRPKGWPEIYALEQSFLADEPERELKLQALRIGDVAIAAIPDEVFAITGLKLKLQSPHANTFSIELANGNEGYIPPPEQHTLGGYTTWAARTAALEVQAEPKIVERLLQLLEQVTGKRRRAVPKPGGEYATAVLKSKPLGYWRLADIGGDVAVDESGHKSDAHYEGGFAHYLPGPPFKGMAANGRPSLATHFVGGRVHAKLPDVGGTYSIEFWFWNGLPDEQREFAALFAHGQDQDEQARGDHVGTTANGGDPTYLYISNGERLHGSLMGRTTIAPRTWNHVVLVRFGDDVRLYLNGQHEPEISGSRAVDPQAASTDWFFAGRNDRRYQLQGKLSEAAIYDCALTADDAARHYEAARTAPGRSN